jgi:hypothetical protein
MAIGASDGSITYPNSVNGQARPNGHGASGGLSQEHVARPGEPFSEEGCSEMEISGTLGDVANMRRLSYPTKCGYAWAPPPLMRALTEAVS